MNKNKIVEETENEELSSHQNLLERISSIEYRLDNLADKISNMRYGTPIYQDVPLPKENPVITSHLLFLTAGNYFTLSISGEHFSKPNNLFTLPQIRTAYVSIYSNSDQGFTLSGFPKNVPIDENGKFQIRARIEGSRQIIIVARNNHTDEYAPRIRWTLTFDGNSYGISNG